MLPPCHCYDCYWTSVQFGSPYYKREADKTGEGREKMERALQRERSRGSIYLADQKGQGGDLSAVSKHLEGKEM